MLALALAGGLPSGAKAQTVFVCRTLYDDLTSFDRRAWQALLDATDRPYGAAEQEVLPSHRVMPAIIRNDPIRLRLVAQLRWRGCERVGHYSFFAEERARFDGPRGAAEPVVRAKD